jgi:hypothetical protein
MAMSSKVNTGVGPVYTAQCQFEKLFPCGGSRLGIEDERVFTVIATDT